MENLPENIQEMLRYLQFQHQQNAKWSTVSLYGFVSVIVHILKLLKKRSYLQSILYFCTNLRNNGLL